MQQKNGVAAKKQIFVHFLSLKSILFRTEGQFLLREKFSKEFSALNYWIRRSNLPSSEGNSDKQNTGMASLKNGLDWQPETLCEGAAHPALMGTVEVPPHDPVCRRESSR